MEKLIEEIPVLQKNREISKVPTNSESTCCAQPSTASACCAPSKSPEDNGGACCAQPDDGSACCNK